MSSYATLSLGPLTLGQTRNGIDPGIMWIFRPSDKLMERIDKRDREQLANVMGEQVDADNSLARVEYRCTAGTARDRLDLKGFTYTVAEARFKQELKAEVQHAEDLAQILARNDITSRRSCRCYAPLPSKAG